MWVLYGQILLHFSKSRRDRIHVYYTKQFNDNFLLENIGNILHTQMLGADEMLPLIILADTFGIAQELTKYLPYD